jgi:hypothetical protein
VIGYVNPHNTSGPEGHHSHLHQLFSSNRYGGQPERLLRKKPGQIEKLKNPLLPMSNPGVHSPKSARTPIRPTDQA